MSDEEKQAWDRQPHEMSRAFELFSAYRDLGPERSLTKARTITKGSPSLRRLKTLSARWNWVERAQAYDDDFERHERRRLERERRQMNERHAKLALLAQNITVKGLEKLLAKVQEDKQPVAVADLTRLFYTGVKVERLSRGEPTEIEKSEHTGSLDIEARYRSMTPEERRAEMVRILHDELGKTGEEAEVLADQIAGTKSNALFGKP